MGGWGSNSSVLKHETIKFLCKVYTLAQAVDETTYSTDLFIYHNPVLLGLGTRLGLGARRMYALQP